MADIYLPTGYIDMGGVLDSGTPFIAMTGARGTGKTYGALLSTYQRGETILYLRRTGVQLDIVTAQPDILYKKINEDHNLNIVVESNKGLHTIIDATDREHEQRIGYVAALSTFKNMRSVDLSDITVIIYDEFCSDDDRPIKNEGLIFLNIVESVGRNRELQGRPPLKVLMMSNSIDLENAIFTELGLVRHAIKLMRDQKLIYRDTARGITLYNIFNSPISEKKKDTALYRLTENTTFKEMALYNKYMQNDLTHVKSMNLKNYTLIISIGEINIYRSKDKRGFYVSPHRAGIPRDQYTAGDNDLKRARMVLTWAQFAYVAGDIMFEDYETEIIFKKYLNIKK